MSDPARNLIVLTADDSEDDRFFFQLALKKAEVRARLFCVNDGEEAVEYLSHAGRFSGPAESPLPDYMFLDLKMPGRNGFEVLEWVAKQSTPFHFPIVVLSGSHEPADMRRAKELGATDYIVKPITPDKLRQILLVD